MGAGIGDEGMCGRLENGMEEREGLALDMHCMLQQTWKSHCALVWRCGSASPKASRRLRHSSGLLSRLSLSHGVHGLNLQMVLRYLDRWKQER